MSFRISICISTWCRKEYLNEIVDLLENQSISNEFYEIIVCDSYSDDGTVDLMKSLCNLYKNIRYINTDKNVLAVKRNIGIQAAESPIIVFMDDDVFPTYGFVEAHLNAHSNKSNTLFCGQIRFPKEWIEESNYYKYRDECHLNENDKKVVANLPFNKIVVMNLSFKKDEVLKKVGFVDERFIGYGGEDTEFGYRICQKGFKLVYLEKALAYHREKSSSILSFGEKIYRSGRDGAKTLNSINNEILKNTQLAYFDRNQSQSNFKFSFLRVLYMFIINKYLAQLVGTYLVKIDKYPFLYNKKLYRYYLAYKFKQGVLDQKNTSLTLEEVKRGWYE